jgi:hypothetical protein
MNKEVVAVLVREIHQPGDGASGLAEQIFLVAARKVISNGGDLDRKGKKCRDSKETFRNRLYIRCFGRAIRGTGFAG